MTNSDVDRLQSTDTNGALGEVGVGINQDLELAEHADQQITEVPANDCAQVGAAAFDAANAKLTASLTKRQQQMQQQQ